MQTLITVLLNVASVLSEKKLKSFVFDVLVYFLSVFIYIDL